MTILKLPKLPFGRHKSYNSTRVNRSLLSFRESHFIRHESPDDLTTAARGELKLLQKKLKQREKQATRSYNLRLPPRKGSNFYEEEIEHGGSLILRKSGDYEF
jgi:hypothetical protein